MGSLAISANRGPAFRRETAFVCFNEIIQSGTSETAKSSNFHTWNITLRNTFIESAKAYIEDRGGLWAVE